jgi:hypothetical protein
MDTRENHSEWDGVAAIVAAIWLILVSAQAVIHLIRYQVPSPPEWAWRLDFTPGYFPLLAGTAVVLLLRRWNGSSKPKPQ